MQWKNGALSGVCFTQERIACKCMFSSCMTAKHSHYNLETGFWVDFSHTHGFQSRMELRKKKRKKEKDLRVCSIPVISTSHSFSSFFLCLLQFLRCLYVSSPQPSRCHACLHLHRILTSAERRDFSSCSSFSFFLSFCLINLISLSLHSSMQGGIRIHKTFLRIIFKLRLASMSYYHTHLKNKETALCKLRSWLLFRGLANCCHHNGVMHEEGDVSLLDDLYVLPRTYARPKWPFP